jgi:UDP-N-acetylglucosamine acyltransferase
MIHHSAIIDPTAFIGINVSIDEDVYIGPFCAVGLPPEWKGKEHHNEGVHIGKGTKLMGYVSIDAGAEHRTFIGDNCYIQKHTHISHDCFLEDDVTAAMGVVIAGKCTIGKGTNIGMNASIHQGVYIPPGCMIGANSFVAKKSILLQGMKYAGVPIRLLGPNIRK